jgi:UDP-glucose 4-epimerase
MMDLRVLVTGGAGFIGSHLVEHLLARGARVCVLDDLSTGSPANLPRHGRLELVRGSVTDRAALRRAGGADLVFHLAAVVGVRLAHRARERAFEVAELGTRNVIECSGSARLVLFSSSAVYAHCGHQPVPEEAASSVAELIAFDGGAPGYASGKARMEELGRAAAAAGRRVLVVRPFNVVGARQSGRYGMVVPSMVESALRGDPLTVYDDGGQSRCFSHVRTFVATLAGLVAREESWRPECLAVNVGAHHPTRIGDLARLVLSETRSGSAIRHVPYDRAFPGRSDVRTRVPDTRRCDALVGETDWPGARAIVRDVVAGRRAWMSTPTS